MVDDGAIEMLNVFVLTPFWSSHPERLRVSAAYRNLIVPCGNQEKIMEQGGLKALVHLATRTRAPRMAHAKRGVSDYNGRGKTHRIGTVKRDHHKYALNGSDVELMNTGGPTASQATAHHELSTDKYQQVLDQIGDNCASALLAISGNSKLQHLIVGDREVAGILALKSGVSNDKFGNSKRGQSQQDHELAAERARHRNSFLQHDHVAMADAEATQKAASKQSSSQREQEQPSLFSPAAIFSSDLLAEIEQETWFNGSTAGRGVGRAPPPEDVPMLQPPSVTRGLQMSEENAPHVRMKQVSVPWAMLGSLHRMTSLPFPGTRVTQHPVHTSSDAIHTTSLDLDSLAQLDIGGLPIPPSLISKRTDADEKEKEELSADMNDVADTIVGDPVVGRAAHSSVIVRDPSSIAPMPGPQKGTLVGSIRGSSTVNLSRSKNSRSWNILTSRLAVSTKSSQLCFPINPLTKTLEQLPTNDTSGLSESSMWMLFPKLTIGKEWEHKQLPESQRKKMWQQEQELMFERRVAEDTEERDQIAAAGDGSSGAAGVGASVGGGSGVMGGPANEHSDGGGNGGMERERLTRSDALGRSMMMRRMQQQSGRSGDGRKKAALGSTAGETGGDGSAKAMVKQMTKQLNASCGWLQERKKEVRKRKEAERLQQLENKRKKEMQRNIERRSLLLDEEMVEKLANHANALGVGEDSARDSAKAGVPRNTTGRALGGGSSNKNGPVGGGVGNSGNVSGAGNKGGGGGGTYTARGDAYTVDEPNSRTSSRISSSSRTNSRSPNSSRASSRTTSRDTKSKGWGKEWVGGGDSVDGVGGVLDQSAITNSSSYSSLSSSTQSSRTNLDTSIGPSEGCAQSQSVGEQAKRRTFNSSGSSRQSLNQSQRRPSRIFSRRFQPARGSMADHTSSRIHSRRDYGGAGSKGGEAGNAKPKDAKPKDAKTKDAKSKSYAKGQSFSSRESGAGGTSSRLAIPAYRNSSSSMTARSSSGQGPGTTIRTLVTGSRYASTG
jgi:hypothetical protein